MFSNDETVKVTKMKSKFYLGTYEPVLISLLFIFNEVQSKVSGETVKNIQ